MLCAGEAKVEVSIFEMGVLGLDWAEYIVVEADQFVKRSACANECS